MVAETPFRLPSFKGSPIRGAFGAALKQACCPFLHSCNGRACVIHNACVYFEDFRASRPKSDPGNGKKVKEQVHRAKEASGSEDEPVLKPYVLVPPLDDRRVFERGDHLEMRLTLIGRATGNYPYYFAALERMGEVGVGGGRGRLRIESASFEAPGQREPVYESEGRWLWASGCKTFTLETVRALCPSDVRRVEIRFRTPTQLKKDGRTIQIQAHHSSAHAMLPLETLVSSLCRRINRLSDLYGEGLRPIDTRELMEQAKGIACKGVELRKEAEKRFSGPQHKAYRLEGFVGSVTYCGEGLSALLPLLKFGEYLHVGKGPVFGMGRYEVWTC